MTAIHVILITMLALYSVIVVLYGSRIILRHLMRNWRESQIGELQWYRIVPESRNAVDASRTADLQVASIHAFVNSLQSKWPYFTRGVASLIWQKDTDGQLKLYIGLDRAHSTNGSASVKALAKGVNCRADELEHAPDVPKKGLIVAHREMPNPSAIKAAPNQLGMVAVQLSEAKELNGTVIFTIEDMTPSESGRLQAWMSQERARGAGDVNKFSTMGDLSNIMSSSGMRASIAAVSYDENPINSNALLSLTIGSITTLALRTQNWEPRRYWYRRFISASMIALAVFFLIGLSGAIPWLAVAILSVGPAAILIACITNTPYLVDHWYEQRLSKGEVAVPNYTRFSIRWFIVSRIKAMRAGDGFTSSGPAAPSTSQVIPMYGSSITEVMSIPNMAGIVDIAEETVPQIGVSALYDIQGKESIFLGVSGSGQPIGIPMSDINFPVFVAGAPDSGKSNLLEVGFSSAARASARNASNLQITPIWGESTKGEGAYDAWSTVKNIPNAVFIDSHNPLSGFRLALEGRRMNEGATAEEIVANATALTSAFQFAFQDEIRASSRESLDFAIRISLLLTEDEIRFLEIDRYVRADKPNVIELAYYIIGGDPVIQPGVKLEQLRSQLDPTSDSRSYYLFEAIGTMSPYLDPRNRGAQERKAPPLNKLSDLRKLRTFWTPDENRADVYVGQLPGHFAPIVLNMGPYWIPEQQSYSGVDKILGRKILLSTNYLMWEHIQRHNSGWASQGKRTVLFLDEVSDIAVDTDSSGVSNVLEGASKQGRSYGFAIWSATQFPRQLPLQAYNEVLSYRSRIWFQMPNADDARIAINNMGAESAFTKENLQYLTKGVAIVGSLKYQEAVIPPFTLKTPSLKNWKASLQATTTLTDAVDYYMQEIYPTLHVAQTPA